MATAAKQAGRGSEGTKFSIFVLHNKDKEKKGHLPEDMIKEDRYLAARTVGDVWINYPWEATYGKTCLARSSRCTDEAQRYRGARPDGREANDSMIMNQIMNTTR